MKTLLLLIIFLLSPIPILSEDLITVTRVIDGDTIEAVFQDGRIERIRMIGVDCPESLKANNPYEYKGIKDVDYLRKWAVQIKAYTINRLENKKVLLKYDSLAGERGIYGRILAYIIADESNFSVELVRKGFARVYTRFPCELMSVLLLYQKEAMAKKSGLWSGHVENVIIIQNDFIIATDVHYDPENNDNKNVNDEYFALQNITDKPLKLAGWVIADANGKHTFQIPEGFILESGKLVYIYTGFGQNTRDKLYWGSHTAIWNNTGDKIYISNPTGEIFELYSWN